MGTPPPKLPDVQAEVRRLLDQGFLFFVPHARQRMQQRGFLATDVGWVLRHGRRIEMRDEYDKVRDTWRYVIEGRMLDSTRVLRVVFVLGEEPPLPNPCVRVITLVDPNE